MGRKLDLSGLTEDEAEHVLRVVQRDMKLRKREEDRLSDLKQELEEEGAHCLLLAGRQCFNQQCCIRCCRPFGFLRHPRRHCRDCRYNVCGTCCTYSQQQGGYVCTACQKSRFLRTQSLDWYYSTVKSRFKRFGSAKVLKTLYKKHRIERGELPESSAPEGSNENDGSVCGSDSTFYRQSEGRSMADTLTVALRVAEEAIEEAIAKAESYRDSLEKQNEARYLHDHREELIEELATTIVQRIIHRGKRSEMQAEYDFVWSQAQLGGLPPPVSTPSTQDTHTTSQHSNLAQTCLKNSYSLWRSQSAFSLTSDESPDKPPEADETAGGAELGEEPHMQLYSSLRRESRASVPGWKSVDRLDKSSASSVLQSPDGNWMALQSSQHSRPGLLTKRKSLVFSVLEKESDVVSAYDEMGSDSEAGDPGGSGHPGNWDVALRQLCRRLSDEKYYTDPPHDPEWPCSHRRPAATSPSSGQHTNTEMLNSDSEASAEPTRHMCQTAQNCSRAFSPHSPYTPYSSYRHLPAVTVSSDALDVNFNPRVCGDSSEGEEQSEQIRRFRRRRRSKRELAEHSRAHSALYSAATAENSAVLLNAMMLHRQRSLDAQPRLNYQTTDTVTPPYLLTSGAITPEPGYHDVLVPNTMATSPPTLSQNWASKIGQNTQAFKLSTPSGNDILEQELRSKLSELVGKITKEDMTSSEDEPIRKVGKRRDDKESEKECEHPWQRDRKSKRETEKSRRKMEGSSDRWTDGQIWRERDTSTTARQRDVERDWERETEAERTMKRQRELDMLVERGRERRERNAERQQETTAQMSRETQGERERRAEKARAVEDGGADRARVAETVLETLAHLTRPTARRTDYAARRWKSADDSETEDEAVRRRARRAPMQRSESERGPEKRAPQAELKRTRSAFTMADSAPSGLEDQACPTEKYSAASLCSITTEVLKVLNATEELIGEAEGKVHNASESTASTPLSSGPESKRLDQHLTKMEENVYLTAGSVYSLEGALSELEDCARNISSSTTETELAFLEDQVASAAAQVQQSELQISDIEARISALKNAGLNVSTCSRFSKYKPNTKSQTLDSSRQQRRKLPAPPATEKESNPDLQVRSPQT